VAEEILMKALVRSLMTFAGVSALLGGTLAACSSSTPVTVAVPCDDAKCAAGNKCITGFDNVDLQVANDPKKATEKCRLVCDPPDPTTQSAQDLCPTNYHCVAGGTLKTGGGSASYCVPDRPSIKFPAPAANKGQWGASCNPAQGLDTNPACDTDNSFWCYANSPTDGSAICTQFQCTDDLDCKGGYFCATVNQNPSATTDKRSFSQTTTVCLPRAWNLWPGSRCAPCKTDIDCPLNDGHVQHCVGTDSQGGAEKMCAAECGSDKNCNLDNKCVTTAEGPQVCVPRAGTCKGDGNFCSPCSSDKDCKNGFCTTADYSTERFCTFKSTTPCTVVNNTLQAACPPTLPGDTGVSCYTKASDGLLRDQCIGLVQFGSGVQVVGCWTPARK
jgi:hypothetical protein